MVIIIVVAVIILFVFLAIIIINIIIIIIIMGFGLRIFGTRPPTCHHQRSYPRHRRFLSHKLPSAHKPVSTVHHELVESATKHSIIKCHYYQLFTRRKYVVLLLSTINYLLEVFPLQIIQCSPAAHICESLNKRLHIFFFNWNSVWKSSAPGILSSFLFRNFQRGQLRAS